MQGYQLVHYREAYSCQLPSMCVTITSHGIATLTPPLLLHVAVGQQSTTRSHKVFIAPIQVQMQIAVAGLPC